MFRVEPTPQYTFRNHNLSITMFVNSDHWWDPSLSPLQSGVDLVAPKNVGLETL